MAPSKKSRSKNNTEDSQSSETINQNTKGRLQISVAVPSLSGLDSESTAAVINEIRNNIFNSMNDAELQRSLDKWIKENHSDNQTIERDYLLLKSVVTEYLDSYMLFGYNTQGERIIIQHANNPKDRDAIAEFLKTIFLQQQQSNFLDMNGEDMDDDQDDGFNG